MKVAIIGAGISGLSCAYELEKNGIIPTIFEKRSLVGEALGYTNLWLRLFIRSTGSPLKYIKKKYDLAIEPLANLKEINMISPNKRTDVRGNLGFIFKRGEEAYSLENQIASKVKTPILFDTYISINDIKNEFDHIVVATANPTISKQLNVWTDTFVAQTRIAVVLGNFKTDCATVWFNEDYADKAFCYLIPSSEKEASLILLIDDTVTKGIDVYWEKFLSYENIQYPIIQTSDAEHACGFVSPLKVENIYFVGSAAGLTDDLIGIGSFNAIESGILAARSIVNGYDYNRLVQPIFSDIVKLHEFRKIMNSFDNSDYDKSISFLGLPGIKQFIYNNPFFKLRYGASLAKIYNKLK